MSKLQELIWELCPDGVEYKTIQETVGVNRGKRLTKRQLSDDGKYDVYHGSKDSILGKYTDYNAPGNTVIIINTGGIGGVKFLDKPFWCSDGSFWLGQSHYVNPKYLYYYLAGYEDFFYSQRRVGGVPTIDRSVVEKFEIPIPPLEVQEEIVRILDHFTNLAAELQAELQARKEQYEYYRNKLLTFDKIGGGTQSVTWMKMSEICLNITSGGTPNTSQKEYYMGNIPWLRTQEVDWHDILDTDMKISEEGLKKSSAKMIPINCVIVAMYGATAAKVAINKIPLCTNQACCNLEINPQKAYYRFVYQWLCKEYGNLRAKGEGSQHNINSKKIKNYLIPIPSLAEQERIAAILDRFERLTTDLQIGLPAEIAAVQEQYEYYRNKLLSFPRTKISA